MRQVPRLIVITVAIVGAVVMLAQTRQLNLRGNRFEPLSWEKLTPQQKTLISDLLAGSRTNLDGPFNVLLRSPEMGNQAQKLGEYVRFHTSVPTRLNEMAILMTARWWSSQFEWYAHEPLAKKAGLSASLIDDIHAGKRPAGMQPDETIVYDFCTEMREHRRVSDTTFAAAKKLLGEKGVVDLAALMGYYDLVSIILNLDRYPLAAGATLPFPEPK
jgi:4-carboxymuconolactone decarboxylase